MLLPDVYSQGYKLGFCSAMEKVGGRLMPGALAAMISSIPRVAKKVVPEVDEEIAGALPFAHRSIINKGTPHTPVTPATVPAGRPVNRAVLREREMAQRASQVAAFQARQDAMKKQGSFNDLRSLAFNENFSKLAELAKQSAGPLKPSQLMSALSNIPRAKPPAMGQMTSSNMPMNRRSAAVAEGAQRELSMQRRADKVKIQQSPTANTPAKIF